MWASFSRRALSKVSWAVPLLLSGLAAAEVPVIHEPGSNQKTEYRCLRLRSTVSVTSSLIFCKVDLELSGVCVFYRLGHIYLSDNIFSRKVDLPSPP